MSQKYYRNHRNTTSSRLLKFAKFFVASLLVSILAVVGYFAYDIYRQANQGEQQPVTSTATTSTVASSTHVLTTQYFQFQASTKWRAVPNETKNDKFVFRQYNATTIEQDLTVYVNSAMGEVLALSQSAYVLPVVPAENGILKVQGGVSPHCKTLLKPGYVNKPQVMTHNKVTFNCTPDSSTYTVAVGMIGGGVDMPLKRPDGTTATYRIVYRNLTAGPTARDIESIVSNFETR